MCFDAPGMCMAPWGQMARVLKNILLLSRLALSVKAITEHTTKKTFSFFCLFNLLAMPLSMLRY